MLHTVASMVEACRSPERPLGLVPTMGYLHEGHLAMVREARARNATVAVSIFVNPTQFGPGEDFDDYPRDRERDLTILEKEGVDLVFAPSTAELYPTGTDTWVETRGLSQRLEGKYRRGHFTGVATVVAKLFNIIGPNRAYFGQKDGQQAAIIKAMVRDLNMQVKIVVSPTVRDSDGLALSSRNSRLSDKERRAATVIYRSLYSAEALWKQGERSGDVLRREVRLRLAEESLVSKVDYVSVAHPETLEELETATGRIMISTAIWVGTTRLIDNLVLDPDG